MAILKRNEQMDEYFKANVSRENSMEKGSMFIRVEKSMREISQKECLKEMEFKFTLMEGDMKVNSNREYPMAKDRY